VYNLAFELMNPCVHKVDMVYLKIGVMQTMKNK